MQHIYEKSRIWTKMDLTNDTPYLTLMMSYVLSVADEINSFFYVYMCHKDEKNGIKHCPSSEIAFFADLLIHQQIIIGSNG